MKIFLYLGEKGWDWGNAVEPTNWEHANRVAQWLAQRAVEYYGDVYLVACGVYGHGVACYDETGARDVALEESLEETISETLKLFVENQEFWFNVPVPYEPHFSCDYDAFLRLESAGAIRVFEPRDDQAADGLYALTDLSEESWVGEVAEVCPDAIPQVRVGDYVVCDGIGADVRFYRK